MSVFIQALFKKYYALHCFLFLVSFCCIWNTLKGCTPAPPTRDEGMPDCNFTSGLCEWENGDDGLEWIIVNSTSYNNSTRISFPYPGDTAGYATLNFENTAHYFREKKATLSSPMITDPVCMNFFFYIHGNETGTLMIQVKESNRVEQTVFYRFGDHGPTWQTGQVFLNITGEYTVVITAEVGNHEVYNILAIDQISFSNESCQQLPVECFNCTMSHSFGEWKYRGWFGMSHSYEQKLSRYVARIQGVVGKDKTNDKFGKFDLRSPGIDIIKGCFRFAYRSERTSQIEIYVGRLFLFAVSLDQEEFPLWNQNIYDSVSWTEVEVEMNFSPHHFQLLIQGLQINGYIYFRDFVFSEDYKGCKSTVEKTFYISSYPSHPQNITISEQYGFCDSYPDWSFQASVVPSLIFPQPMFVYSIYNSLVLNAVRNDTIFGALQRYFYVSNNRNNESHAMYLTRETGGIPFVTRLGTQLIMNTNNSIIFVKEIKRIVETNNCEPGWAELGGKCYKLFCGLNFWSKARLECFRYGADLAFLDESFYLITTYLERVGVSVGGVKTISIGLERIGQNWTWLDGKLYNGTIDSLTPKARLVWKDTSNKWVIEGAEKIAYPQAIEEISSSFLCQKLRVNSAYLKITSQSNNSSEYSSNLAVDGNLATCSHIMSSNQSWWQVDLGGDVKIFKMKIIPSSDYKDITLLNISIFLKVSKMINQRSIVVEDDDVAELLYEPPITIRYVEIRTSRNFVLCELETYATDKIKTLHGVSWSFGKMLESFFELMREGSEYSLVGGFFGVIPSFYRPDFYNEVYQESMEGYFMTEVSGNYSFISSGDANVKLILSSNKEAVTSPIFSWEYSLLKQENPVQHIASCKFYLLKIIKKEEEGKVYSLDIRSQSNLYDDKPIKINNFFWVLPGKLEVDFSFVNKEINEIVISVPLILTGNFQSHCNGFYCGYCSLAYFLHFADFFECTVLPNLSVGKSGSLQLNLTDWVIYPGDYDISMGYLIDGNCSEIVKRSSLDLKFNTDVSVISRFRIKPIALIRCIFDQSSVCDRDVNYEGWNRVKLPHDDISEYGFQSMPNTSSSLSLGWIKDSAVTQVTGICITFLFKMEDSANSNLSLFMETSSGLRNQIWSLSGYHGNNWKPAAISLPLEEGIMVHFEVSYANPNETVSIANVKVETKQCPTNIEPYYARPDHSCTNKQFRCDNGECIRFIHRCNNIADCTDRSDEANCDCKNEEFQCENNNQCVSLNQLCNGEKECKDGSDERVCDLCEINEFYCPSGKCIYWNDTCNGLSDCLDGSDEPDLCQKSLYGIYANKTCSLNQLGCLHTSEKDDKCKYFQGDCDFENGFCGWFNVPTNISFEWLINQGPTHTIGTGPQVDHTTRSSTGSYAYMKASNPHSLQGSTIRLLGGPFQGGQPLCFQFYHHMFGPGIGQLNVYTTTSYIQGNGEKHLVWTKIGSSDEQWHETILTINIAIDFKIIIEAVRGKGPFGDIAIDDIIIKLGACTNQDFDESIAPCSFDDVCHWSDTENWEKGFDDSSPLSFLQGSYISTEAPFSLSKIIKEPMTATYQCLSFWHSHTTNCHDTLVYFRQVSRKHYWDMNIINMKDGIEDWQFIEIPLRQSSEEYTISLNATVDYNSKEKCAISLDEINLSLEPCMIIQESQPVLARHGPEFHHGRLTLTNDQTFTVFFTNSSVVYGVYNKNNINQIVHGSPVNRSKILVGSRVVVENDMEHLVLATVVKDCRAVIHEDYWCNLTAILDTTSQNITIFKQRVWLLPFQMDDSGAMSNTAMECKAENRFKTYCYYIIREANWFDAVDDCKQFGGKLLYHINVEEMQFIARTFENVSSFWVGDPFIYSMEKFRNSTNNSSFYEEWEEFFEARFFYGYCPVMNNLSWTENQCGHYLQSVCKVPGKQRTIFCGIPKVKKILQCDNGRTLRIFSAIIGQDLGHLFDCFNFNLSSYQTPCNFPDHTKKIKQKCDGNTSCNVENEFDLSLCRSNYVYFDISYNCEETSEEEEIEFAEEENEEFVEQGWCPNGYVSFQLSCYKMVDVKRTWSDAQQFCALTKGSNLVKLADKDEDDFLVVMMAAVKSYEFWIGLNDREYEDIFQWADKDDIEYSNWESDIGNNRQKNCVSSTKNGWVKKECNQKLAFVCAYFPSKVSCDFEHNWCGWEQSDLKNFNWIRDKHEVLLNIPPSLLLAESNTSSPPLLGPLGLFIWSANSSGNGIMILSTGIKYKMPAFTLCVWLNPTDTVNNSVVFSYGSHKNLMIYFDSNVLFKITIQDITITTDSGVLFQTWQHICVSMDNTMRMWRLFKDGVLVETGISTIPIDDSRQITVGGQVTCSNNFCSINHSFLGKMTQLKMWLSMLDLHEVLMLSTGCGLVSSGNIPLTIFLSTNVRKYTSYHEECRNGKGWRLTFLTNPFHNSSSVVSSWIRSSTLSSYGVCLVFAYRLFGNSSKLSVALERKGGNIEVLWKTESFSENQEWQYGRVYLGISLHFRIYFTGTVDEDESLISIDNIFFKPGICNSLPKDAQGRFFGWDTRVSINSSGFLLSPYYPSFYLNNMRRTWKLTALIGQRISVKFLYLDMEDDVVCSKDFIKIQDGVSVNKVLLLCGRTLPSVFISDTEVLNISFQTGSKNIRTGFKLQYNVVDAISNDICYFTDVPDCPERCHCHRWPADQTKISVTGKDLQHIPSRFPGHTSAIYFDKNFITQLTKSDFSNCPQLEYINLNENRVSIIEASTFQKLNALKSIQLSTNNLREIPRNVFHETTSLQVLDLGGNRIRELESFLFVQLTQLVTLSLRLNRLIDLNENVFNGLEKLEFLYLDGNDMFFIHDNVFRNVTKLKYLHLQWNKLNIVKRKWLEKLTSLRTLKLNDNQLESIEPGSFDNLHHLIELDLSNNRFETIPENLFKNLHSLQRLKVDHFTLCCYAEKTLPSVSCTSLGDNGVSSCDELLKNSVLKYAIWILGVMALFGNLAVVIWRIFHKDKNKVSSFLLTNLAVADFLMGVFLVLIAYQNTVWSGVYFKHDISWRSSDLCIIAGIVATVSSEVSVLTLSVITFDRLICLVFPFRFRKMSMKKAVVVMFIIWLLGLVISILPLFFDDYFYDHMKNVHFYGRSAVCLPFHLSSEKTPGWEYSTAIFLGLNGTSFVFILVAYVIMYRTITKAASAVRSTRMNQDSTLAKRMMVIILTDFFCWFPVIIISVLALTGTFDDPRKEAYAWIAVFVLPINSSINPLLYTFSTVLGKKGNTSKSIHSKSDQSNVRKTFSETLRSKSSPQSSSTVREQKPKTVATKSHKPSVIHRHEMLNDAFQDDEAVINESCFIAEQPTKKTITLKLIKLINSCEHERNIKTNFLAFYEIDHALTQCLVQVYDKTYIKSWENTKRVLSSIKDDSQENNLLLYLWSATANEICIEVDDISNDTVLHLKPDDSVICYIYPSKETLEDFLSQSEENMTVRSTLAIAKYLIRAICYLHSKQIIHHAIFPRNIIISRTVSNSVKADLGGLSSAQFIKPSSEDKQEELFDDVRHLKKPSNDLRLYGQVLEFLLKNCRGSSDLVELNEIIDSCLEEETEEPVSAQDVLNKIEAINMEDDTLL